MIEAAKRSHAHDFILDLTDPAEENKVLVTGYDFLLDSGKVMRETPAASEQEEIASRPATLSG